MSNTLNTGALIPKSQPYNASPWAYGGTESVTTVPAGTVDWILVELRQADAPSNATSTTTFARRAAFLKSDGAITDLDGISPVQFTDISLTGSNNLYVVIRHRNHLAIMSSVGVSSSNGVFSYDFTISLSQAYGGGNGYKQVGSAFAMISGDTDQDGSINVTDYNAWAAAFGFTNGYTKPDLDMDGSVLVSDYNKWAANFGMANAANLKSATNRPKYFSGVPE